MAIGSFLQIHLDSMVGGEPFLVKKKERKKSIRLRWVRLRVFFLNDGDDEIDDGFLLIGGGERCRRNWSRFLIHFPFDFRRLFLFFFISCSFFFFCLEVGGDFFFSIMAAVIDWFDKKTNKKGE